MSKIIMKKEGVLQKEYDILHEAIMNLGNSVERKETIKLDDMVFAVYEKYYIRSNNYTSCSIVVRQVESYVTLLAIGAAGGGGVFNISWGAENRFIADLEKQCSTLGYQHINRVGS